MTSNAAPIATERHAPAGRSPIDQALDLLEERLASLSEALAGGDPDRIAQQADRLHEAIGHVKLASRPLLPRLPEPAVQRLQQAKAIIRAQHEALARAQAQNARELAVLVPDAASAGYGRQGGYNANALHRGSASIAV